MGWIFCLTSGVTLEEILRLKKKQNDLSKNVNGNVFQIFAGEKDCKEEIDVFIQVKKKEWCKKKNVSNLQRIESIIQIWCRFSYEDP